MHPTPPPLYSDGFVMRQMVYDRFEAEKALVRYYNTPVGRKAGKKQRGPLWEALAMVKTGFGVNVEPFLQVKFPRSFALCPSPELAAAVRA